MHKVQNISRIPYMFHYLLLGLFVIVKTRISRDKRHNEINLSLF